MDNLANRLARALLLRGKKAPWLAKEAGLTKQAVYNIIDDITQAEKIRASTVDAICDALSVRKAWLLSGSEPMVDTSEVVGRHESRTDESQVRRFDLKTLAQAAENVGKSGTVPEDALFAEYERLKALRTADLAAKRKQRRQRDELKQRGSAGTGQHPERKGGKGKE